MGSLMLMAAVSLLFIIPARANIWVGNDDGEFGVGSPGYPLYVGLQETFSSTMTWSSSPPNNLVSMQYNPDYWASAASQWGAQWFQTAIISNSLGCGTFTIQVYSTVSSILIWRADQAIASCSQGFLASNATWVIQENMASSQNRTIVNVYFSVSTPTTSFSYALYTGGRNWIWEISNLCWCGTDLGSTTFSSAYGYSTVYSDLSVTAIIPPQTTATAENSNMPYGTFYWQSNNQHMLQGFGWGPSGGGGGGGGCNKIVERCGT